MKESGAEKADGSGFFEQLNRLTRGLGRVDCNCSISADVMGRHSKHPRERCKPKDLLTLRCLPSPIKNRGTFRGQCAKQPLSHLLGISENVQTSKSLHFLGLQSTFSAGQLVHYLITPSSRVMQHNGMEERETEKRKEGWIRGEKATDATCLSQSLPLSEIKHT
ncbi:hypothetical protein CRENBAI_001618 [Crenichthys baileyi]|uniref:Uncharacterized protein n=1 Tax=Crenichthys baileyi TaxID=28760 RepID=A0AAV9SL69_9TELE